MTRRAPWWYLLLLGCNPSGSTDPDASTAPSGAPAVEIEPPALVAFDPIAAHAVVRRDVVVRSVGEGPLVLEQVSVAAPRPEAWSVVPSAPVGTPVPPGEQVTLRVEYRPCSAAVAAADPCACPRRTDSAILRLKTNASEAAHLLTLAGSAVPPGPRVQVSPTFELELSGREGGAATGTVSVRNSGCGPLTLHAAAITGPGGGSSGAANDFWLEACGAQACELTTTICEAGCDTSQVDLHIRYDNDDPIGDDIAELHLGTDDPATPDRVVLLRGSEPPGCLSPIPLVRTSTRPCIGHPVHLHANDSEPSSPDAAITGFSWDFAFWQPPRPTLEVAEDGRSARFVPERGGLYIVDLTAHTDCGPPGRHQAQIIVAATGCE